MKSEIETLGPCKVKLRIEIPTEEVKDKVEEKYREVRQSVVIPGFRKGHVPRNILEKRFGKNIEDDAKLDLISNSISKTIEEKKVAAIGEPDLDPEKVEFHVEKPMAFEVTVETKPEIKPKDYLGVEAKKPKAVVTDADVAGALDRLSESRSEWVPTEIVAEDDMIIANLSLLDGEKSLMSENDMRVVVSKDIEVLHTAAPTVFQALLGARAGDERAAQVAIPADHKDDNVKGKTLTFKATVKDIKHLKKPELNDAWAKEMDYESLDKVKDELRRRLQADKEAQSLREAEKAIVDALLARHDIPLPEALLHSFEHKAEDRFRLDMQMRGVPEAEVEKMIEKERAASKEEVARTLRAHFLLEAIATKERIFVTEDEVEARVDQMAAASGRMPGEVREMLEGRGQMSDLRGALREEKVRKFLREKAKITEAD